MMQLDIYVDLSRRNTEKHHQAKNFEHWIDKDKPQKSTKIHNQDRCDIKQGGHGKMQAESGFVADHPSDESPDTGPNRDPYDIKK